MKRFLGVVGVLMALMGMGMGNGFAMPPNAVTVYNISGDLVGNYVTIQEGVDACPVGGTVSVSTGTYYESVYINKKIAVVGVGTPTIDPPTDNSYAVTFDGNTSVITLGFSGFIITETTGNTGGGGILCKNTASPRIVNNMITGFSSGSGIVCESNSSPNITSNTITKNGNHGISCNQSSPNISRNTITENSHHGIYCEANSSPSITGNTIKSNEIGIACLSSSPSNIDNNIIESNTSHGIHCNASSPSAITNNTIVSNKAANIDFCNSSSCSVIRGNTIKGSAGAGIQCHYYSSLQLISGNTITTNIKDGIYCEANSSIVSITGNNISNNTQSGIAYSGSANTIINNEIAGNFWHGISLTSSSPKIVNNTIVANKRHGISCESSSSPYIYNNIITNNSPFNNTYYGLSRSDVGSNPIIDYNNVWNNGSGETNNYCLLTPGAHDISRDPNFAKFNGVSAEDDYRLQAISKCVNAGVNTIVEIGFTLPNTDRDGCSRLVSGRVDMGAYEYQSSPPLPEIITSSLPVGIVNRSYSKTLSVIGGTPDYTWSITAGSLPSGLNMNAAEGIISGRPTSSGSFFFTVRVTDSTNSIAAKDFSIIVSSGAVTIYVDGQHQNANDNNTGLDPNYPKQTVQAGINDCPSGGTVTVKAGNYKEGLLINKKLALIGEGTPVIDPPLNDQYAVTFDGDITTGVYFAGFNLSETTNNTGGGGILCKNAASPRIGSNTISGFGGSGIVCSNASLARIMNNTIMKNGQHGIYCEANSSPSITGNTIKSNGAIGIACVSKSSPNIDNNIIESNTSHGIHCNASSPSAITNNTIVSNKAANVDFCNSSSCSVIRGNTIKGSAGAGIQCHYYSSLQLISGNTITTNIKDGIYCEANSSIASITSNNISNNTQSGIACLGSANTIINNEIAGNFWHGISLTSSSPKIVNNTIIANKRHGIFCESSSSPYIYNNIITNNSPYINTYYGLSRSDTGSNPVIDYNNVWNNGSGGTNNYGTLTPGAHDISSDPIFIYMELDALADRDCHLQSSSNCIDTGTISISGIDLSKDKDGNTRNIVDMGAYEYQGNSILPITITTISLPSGIVSNYYQSNLTATGGTLPYNWFLTGSLPSGLSLGSTTGIISGTPTQSGSFTFTVQVMDRTGSSTAKELSISCIAPLTAQINVMPSFGTVGAVITISGSGYAAGDNITVRFGTTASIQQAAVATNGLFVTIFTIDTQQYGTTTVTASGISGYATKVFYILPKVYSVLPTSGTIGTIVTIRGTGYAAGDALVVAFGTNAVIQIAAASQHGSFSTSFTVDVQQYGTTTITCCGVSCSTVNTFFILPQVVRVLPTSGTVGTVVTIRSTGYAAGDSITVVFGTNADIRETVASRYGSFSTTFTVDTQQYGTTTIICCGVSSAFNTFFILPQVVSVLPASGTVGTVVTISGTGYANGDNINVRTNASIQSVAASQHGSFSTTFIIDTQQYGTTTITASGVATAYNRFVILPQIMIMPTSGTVSTVVIIFGTGYAACDAITVAFGTNASIQHVIADMLGYFRTTFSVDTQPCGITTITASGVSSATNVFRILPENVVPASVTVYNPEGSIATYTVTIQAGVDACPEGGTVSVSAGTYNEAVYINKRIALVGVGTPTITAKGIGNTNAVTFDSNGADNASISGFRITGATGSWPNGRGIFCNNSSPTITNNTISGNGFNGISCDYSSYPTISHNTIFENGNEGIGCNNSSPTIINNIILGNKCEGIHCDYSFPTITNNTISENNMLGIYCRYSSSPIITNNIITDNGTTGSDYYGIYVESGNPNFDYNCVRGNGSTGNNNYYNCSPGTNDISANPQFIGSGDYHLGSSSPCIDKGSNTATGIPSSDKDGNPRIVNGTVDMGAYEYQGIQPLTITTHSPLFVQINTRYQFALTAAGGVPPYNWLLGGPYDGLCIAEPILIFGTPTEAGTFSFIVGVEDTAGNSVTKELSVFAVLPPPAPEADFFAAPMSGTKPFSVQFTDQSTGSITSWLWQFGDGNASDVQNPAYTYATAGIYTVSLTVTGPGGSNSTTKADYIVVTEPASVIGLVTVWGPSGNFIGTYTTIQAGVDACPEDGMISVAAGTYNEAVYINKRIDLIGVDTPTITAEGLGNANAVTFDGNSADDAFISGFEITGATGEWSWGGGYGNGICCTNGADIDINDNIITGNSVNGIYCVHESSSTIYNNTILWNGIGIWCDINSSPIITNNIISKNSGPGILSGWAQSLPNITNNVISENSTGIDCYEGSSPTIMNNIISDNVVQGIYRRDSASPIIDYNCIWGNGPDGSNNYSNCSPGTYDISADPQFIGGDDYHLQSTSPCIDRGSNTASGILPFDKDGNPRIFGGTVDMGAYEHQDTVRIKPFVSPVQSTDFDVLLKIQVGDQQKPVDDLFTLIGTLNYTPASGIEILEVKPGDFLGSDLQVFYIVKSEGKVQFVLRRKTGAGGVTGAGSVLDLKLKIADEAAQSGIITFGLDGVEAYNSNKQGISLLPESCGMMISKVDIKPVVYPPILSGTEFEVGVQVGDMGNEVNGLKSVSFDLQWEGEGIIEAVTPVSENVKAGEFLGTDTFGFAISGTRTLSICIGRGSGESSGYGTVAKVKFRALADVVSGTGGTFTISNVLSYTPDAYQIKLMSGSCPFTIELPATWTPVWSGDTNNDGMVSWYDIIPIAFYLRETGPKREATSIEWKSCLVPYWGIIEPPCPDAVYSDANGDGEINIKDVHAIIINNGKTHPGAGISYAAPGRTDDLRLEEYRKVLKNRPDILENVKYLLANLDGSNENREVVALLQDLIEPLQQSSGFKVYPNPYCPMGGISGIRFANLGTNWSIKVYNMAGELVEEMQGAGNDYDWTTAKELASGVYVYIVNSSTLSKKTGKLAIIK